MTSCTSRESIYINWKRVEAHVGKIRIETEKPAYTTNKRRNERHASLGASNSLTETEEKREVAVNAVVPFEFTGGLDTLPRRGDLDEDTVFLDTDEFVQGDELLGLDVTRTIQRASSACLPNYVYHVVEVNLPFSWWLPCQRRDERRPPSTHGRE